VDVTLKVLEEPTYRGFLSLEEAKAALGLPATPDPVNDPLLQIQINQSSAVIARLCNRQFARTKVAETRRGETHPDIYLSLWPVEDDDILGIEPAYKNGGPSIWPPPPPVAPAPGSFDLENFSGKLRVGGIDPVMITYWGGYELPDEAPDDLKYCCILLLRQGKTEAARESVEGIKMIAHKESRVIFFDPNASSGKTSTTTLSGESGIPAVDAILKHYLRFSV
jgi:hypothetical protein